MRGHAARNFPAFDEAERLWKAAGHHPISPASVCRALTQLAEEPSDDFYDAAWERQVINLDIQIILTCDAIALLPNWEQSMGSTIEVALAQFLRLPIFDALYLRPTNPTPFRRLDIPTRPWNGHPSLLASGQQPTLTRQLENARYVPLPSSGFNPEPGLSAPIRDYSDD